MEFNIRVIIAWLIIIYNITFLNCAVKSPFKEFEINLKGQSNLKWNKRLRSAHISQRFSVSLLECVDECFNISTCKSFNYERNLPLCELNYQSEEINRPPMLDPVVVTDENDFIYGDIKYWGICERDGYSYSEEINLCLKVHSEYKNWTDARSVCLSERADLIIVNTTEVYKFINDLLLGIHKWVGATDMEEEGHWRWVDGSILSEDTVSVPWEWIILDNKAQGTTNDGDCLRYYNNRFHDNNCDNTQGFICQRKMV